MTDKEIRRANKQLKKLAEEFTKGKLFWIVDDLYKTFQKIRESNYEQGFQDGFKYYQGIDTQQNL